MNLNLPYFTQDWTSLIFHKNRHVNPKGTPDVILMLKFALSVIKPHP